jgi:hypothetical protein
MLIELVERNMVTDISRYFRSYTGARVEPPSFIISADEMSYYIHVPYGEQADAIRAIDWPEASMAPRGSTGDDAVEKKSSGSLVFRTYGLPKWKEALDDAKKARLAHLASATERSFEIIYESGRFSVLLHSKTHSDLLEYRATFEAIYGTLKFEEVELKPVFLNEVPKMVLQIPNEVPQASPSPSAKQPTAIEEKPPTSEAPQQQSVATAVEEKLPPDAAPQVEQPSSAGRPSQSAEQPENIRHICDFIVTSRAHGKTDAEIIQSFFLGGISREGAERAFALVYQAEELTTVEEIPPSDAVP